MALKIRWFFRLLFVGFEYEYHFGSLIVNLNIVFVYFNVNMNIATWIVNIPIWRLNLAHFESDSLLYMPECDGVAHQKCVPNAPIGCRPRRTPFFRFKY